MSNTRFNPTLNGPLHVGHLYMILMNVEAARLSGGRFIVRFDDDQPYWYDRLTVAEIDAFGELLKEDLTWLGLTPDLYTSERQAREANEQFIHRSFPEDQAAFILEDRWTPDVRYLTVAKSIERPYPYSPYLTGVKVAQDRRESIDLLIRGEDLLSEFSLYSYLCDVAKVHRPTFQYVPRMVRNTGYFQKHADLADVSKTQGGFTIQAYRQAGWKPDDLLKMVAESALKVPTGPWSFANVKDLPILRSAP